jgi:hypothetical protein
MHHGHDAGRGQRLGACRTFDPPRTFAEYLSSFDALVSILGFWVSLAHALSTRSASASYKSDSLLAEATAVDDPRAECRISRLVLRTLATVLSFHSWSGKS